MREVERFNDELRSAEAWVFAGGLRSPADARVIRYREGEPQISDGAYVGGDEHLGGLTILAATDMNEAMEWGRKLAQAITLPVEVRQFQGDVDSHLP